MKFVLNKKKMPQAILSFVVASSFIFTTGCEFKEKKQEIKLDPGQEKYNYFVSQYLSAQKEDTNEYDENFIDIYNNWKYLVEDKQYDIKEVYIVRLNNSDIHFIKAGENKTDIVTGETFNEKKVSICCFRDSSIFYELYSIGMIQDKDIVLTEQMERVASYWNDEKHKETPSLNANSIAEEKYRAKYGK